MGSFPWQGTEHFVLEAPNIPIWRYLPLDGFFFFNQNDIFNVLPGLRVVEEVPSYLHHAHHFHRQLLLISRFFNMALHCCELCLLPLCPELCYQPPPGNKLPISGLDIFPLHLRLHIILNLIKVWLECK